MAMISCVGNAALETDEHRIMCLYRARSYPREQHWRQSDFLPASAVAAPSPLKKLGWSSFHLQKLLEENGHPDLALSDRALELLSALLHTILDGLLLAASDHASSGGAVLEVRDDAGNAAGSHRRELAALTSGAIRRLHCDDMAGVPAPLVQIIDHKVLKSDGKNAPDGKPHDRHRFVISDGGAFMQAMLATQLNGSVDSGQIGLHSVLQLNECMVNLVHDRKVHPCSDRRTLPPRLFALPCLSFSLRRAPFGQTLAGVHPPQRARAR